MVKIECVTWRIGLATGSYDMNNTIRLHLPEIYSEYQTDKRIVQSVGEIITHELIFHHLTKDEVDGGDWCWDEDSNGSIVRGSLFCWEVEKMIRRCLGFKALRTKRSFVRRVKRFHKM